ncbi:HDOD domain-containing protein [Metapseudomonas furukawaii]|uniref:Response regulator n=1 Tax=Metapseudomonas furukawaii TaxID=1149133 RepID=A0AAD1BWH7_METFU|nr:MULTISPECIES: HDOD domain-containing protein [Pseudomonas]ELS27626.1 Response regulator [Pseudomonas furukawaii]OWJ90635.1 response regulator [Pseudomonas sp. A46]BAU71808.1 response regulator [Pseudomonas furukawaii]
MPTPKVPHILIAEPDPWTSDLLAQLVLDVRPDAKVMQVADGREALARCKRGLPDLVIADGELGGIDGVELLRQLRRHPRLPALPFILISGRVDATSVRAVRPLAPSAYLGKPFNAAKLRKRLVALLPAAEERAGRLEPALLLNSLAEYLDSVREEGQGAPLLGDVREAVSQSLQADQVDLRDLDEVFSRDPQITARLIAAANSAAQHLGMPCQTLAQAMQRLGITRVLNLVLGMALERNARLRDPRLAELAETVWRSAQRSAELGYWLASELDLDAELCYTAGLLHNIGELALLRSLQDWQDAGGSLGNEELEDVLRRRAASFGSALRIRWRLPFGLRELVAAFHGLGSGVFSREALVLNLCAALLRLPDDQPLASLLGERSARLLRLDPRLLERIPQRLLR